MWIKDSFQSLSPGAVHQETAKLEVKPRRFVTSQTLALSVSGSREKRVKKINK